MPAGSNCRSPNSFTCSPHEGGTMHLLLSRPYSGFATEPAETAMDAANARFGRGAVTLAATGIKKPWETKFEKRSSRYTTRLSDLPNL